MRGTNIVRIWKFDYYTDDEVGGAVPSGSLRYSNIRAVKSENAPTMPLLEQGVEVEKLSTFQLIGNLLVEENDVLEIMHSHQHRDVNKKYRIISVRSPELMRDRNKYVQVIGKRIERTRIENYQ